MPHLMRIALKDGPPLGDAYPFSVPTIRALPTLDVRVGVTFFVGENGSGKSTLLEAIAASAELPTLGTDEVEVDPTLSHARALGARLRLSWEQRSRRGFFLRAEDFFGYHRSQARIDVRIAREKAESESTEEELVAQWVEARSEVHPDEVKAREVIARYDARSHGESFMDVFTRRIQPGGLHLLDEPEGPLSPRRQIELVNLVAQAANKGAQFIIATHSPILLACPGASIYSFDSTPVARVTYEQLDHVRVLREFLNAPMSFIGPLV